MEDSPPDDFSLAWWKQNPFNREPSFARRRIYMLTDMEFDIIDALIIGGESEAYGVIQIIGKLYNALRVHRALGELSKFGIVVLTNDGEHNSKNLYRISQRGERLWKKCMSELSKNMDEIKPDPFNLIPNCECCGAHESAIYSPMMDAYLCDACKRSAESEH